MTNNKALAEKFWKAANEGDLETLATLVADDCYFIHSDVSGKEQVVQHFNLDPKPEWDQRIDRMIAEDNVVVVESTWHGKATGPYFDYLLEGKATGKKASRYISVRRKTIIIINNYSDSNDKRAQASLPPQCASMKLA